MNISPSALFAMLDERIIEHSPVLLRKRRMLISRDDYGTPLTEKWDSEVKYFVSSILLQDKELDLLFDQAFECNSLEDKEYVYVNQIPFILDALEVKSIPHCDEDILVELENASPEGFEQLCGTLLSRHGWDVVQTGATGDQGADIIGERFGMRVVFQCKKYSAPVGNSAVQQVLAGKVMHRADIAAVVATRGFTNSARELAQAGNVYLLGAADLVSFHTVLGFD